MQGAIDEAVSEYLLELRRAWADRPYLVVRISQIEARILNIPGIVDIQDTLINGEGNNLTLSGFEIPVYGGVSG